VGSRSRERVRANGDLPPPEVFDALFNKWAGEGLQVASFPAEKPQQGSRVPIIVKRKVAQVCEMKICFPDSKPACFRMADSKKVKGDPTIGLATTVVSRRLSLIGNTLSR
jgi:hypothetical protein